MYEELTAVAVEAARASAEILRGYFRDTALEVRSKGHHDFVTRADRESEERVVGVIRSHFPDHQILAEESGFDGGADDIQWIIDPLDGTSNFMQGLPVFAVSIACRRGGELLAAAILDPLGENLWSATRGGGARWNGEPMRVSGHDRLYGAFLATGYPFKTRQALDLYLDVFRAVFLEARSIRRCGAAALDLAYTASGVYDGFFEFRLSPWDFAAGALLITESGGRITNLDGGEDIFTGGNLVAGPAEVQGELLAAIQRFVDEARLDAVDPATVIDAVTQDVPARK